MTVGRIAADKELVARYCEAIDAALQRTTPRGIDVHGAIHAAVLVASSVAVRSGLARADIETFVKDFSDLLREHTSNGIDIIQERIPR